jgi:hypothetical protein
LIEQQLAEREGDDVVYRSNMVSVLRQRELTRIAARLSRELGLAMPRRDRATGSKASTAVPSSLRRAATR